MRPIHLRVANEPTTSVAARLKPPGGGGDRAAVADERRELPRGSPRVTSPPTTGASADPWMP